MQRVLQFYREAEEEGKTIYDSIPHMHSIECANNKIPDVWGLPGGVWLYITFRRTNASAAGVLVG